MTIHPEGQIVIPESSHSVTNDSSLVLNYSIVSPDFLEMKNKEPVENMDITNTEVDCRNDEQGLLTNFSLHIICMFDITEFVKLISHLNKDVLEKNVVNFSKFGYFY